MAKVRFTSGYSYKPNDNTTIDYPAGYEGTVRRECADLAVAAGAAELLEAEDEQQPEAAPVEPEKAPRRK